MKKKRAVAGGLLLVLGIAQSVSAGTTTVTYHVDPSYMVLVPANTTIPFNEESVNYGKIRVEEAQIEEGKCIQVELISDKKLKNQSAKECNVFYGGNCIRCGTFDSGRQPEKKKTRRIDKQTERKAKKGR